MAQSSQAILATLTPSFSTLVNQDATPGVGAYYPLPVDSSFRADVASVDSDANTTDDLYLVYSQAYSLGSGQLVLENTSTTVAAKKIEVMSDDEFATTAPTINANQTGRVFDIVGSGGTPPSLTVVFSGITPQGAPQGLVIEGGLATNDGGLTISTASAVGGAFLIDGGAVALSNVTLQNNEAKGTTGRQGSQGASRTAGPGGIGSTGGNSHGGAIYLAAGSLTLLDDNVTGNVAVGGTGGKGGTGGPGGTFFTFGQFRFFEESL